MRWLRIGMGVKRYVVGIMAGTVLVGLAIAMVLATVYRTVDFPESTSAAVGAVTLQWIAHPVREIIVGTIGFCIMAGSVFLLFRSVISVVIAPGEDVAEMVYRGRLLRRGPQVVSIGGGTGQGVLLRGLKERTANITAVVTVADDGGSSGRLRKEFQLMPPGDLRNCLASLADSEALMTKLLDYRFRRGDGLQGHSLGNLLIAAMRDIAGGVERGVEGLSEVLRIHGSVTPSTASDVHLAAEMVDGDDSHRRVAHRLQSKANPPGVPASQPGGGQRRRGQRDPGGGSDRDRPRQCLYIDPAQPAGPRDRRRRAPVAGDEAVRRQRDYRARRDREL